MTATSHKAGSEEKSSESNLLGSCWQATVITLFPEAFPGPLRLSLPGKALIEKRWRLETVDLRAFGLGRHRTVDDTPFGGGAGMVIRPDVIDQALDHCQYKPGPVFYLSPRGRLFDQKLARRLALEPGIRLLCGRYEGIDQRVIEAHAVEELSIGDYILAGGELAALVVLEAIIRLLPGVLGNAESTAEESFESGLLEYPLYTRPVEWNGQRVPEVLLSGNHKEIERWRQESAERLTKQRRPDIWSRYIGENRARGMTKSGQLEEEES